MESQIQSASIRENPCTIVGYWAGKDSEKWWKVMTCRGQTAATLSRFGKCVSNAALRVKPGMRL